MTTEFCIIPVKEIGSALPIQRGGREMAVPQVSVLTMSHYLVLLLTANGRYFFFLVHF